MEIFMWNSISITSLTISYGILCQSMVQLRRSLRLIFFMKWLT
jgi:hypothetical protein